MHPTFEPHDAGDAGGNPLTRRIRRDPGHAMLVAAGTGAALMLLLQLGLRLTRHNMARAPAGDER